MNIGESIKELRKKCRVTQPMLVKELGISQGYLSLIERGQREPSIELIKQIADALKIPQQLIFLLSCDKSFKKRRYLKHLKKITLAIDAILRTV